MDKPFWMFGIFIVIILGLLILDLGVFHKKQREIGVRESLWMSAFYICMALLFGIFIWYELGVQSFAEYLTSFLVEKSLSLDNIFLTSLVFSSLSIPMKYQHRVLFYGILGAIVFRAIMISLGAKLIADFSWVLYIFAIFMIITGVKMLFIKERKVDIKNNRVLKWMHKHLNITNTIEGQNFLVRHIDPITKKSQIFITPLFVALILIEAFDFIFAVDSVPAVFAITQDPYIVYTSNIFAILGLRALYFALASIIHRFRYLKFSIALVLVFIGAKIFISKLMGMEKFPPMISLFVTFSLLAFGCFYSLYKSREKMEKY